MSHAPGSFCWFECGTTDAAAAKKFYTALFGWTAKDMPLPGGDDSVYTLLQVDGADIAGLYRLAGPQFEGVPPHWISYVAVESADASAARAEELGARILVAPSDIPGVGRMAFLQDPHGARISLFQPGEHSGSDPDKCNLGWCELNTPDKAASREFYTKLFGWGVREDADGVYSEFQVEGRSIAGMLEIPPDERAYRPPSWLPYALIEDCDLCMAKATQLGAQTIVPPTAIENVGKFGVLADPTGAVLAVIKLEQHGGKG